MIEQRSGLRPVEWILTAGTALLGSAILYDSYAGINWGIWVALTVAVTLLCRRSADLARARPPILLGIAAVLTAGAATRTTDVSVHVGIGWLTAFLLGAFLCAIQAKHGEDVGVVALLRSPFEAVAKVVTSAAREIGVGVRAAIGSASRSTLRRVVIVAPVVLLLLILLGSADPVIHSLLQTVQQWLPNFTITDRAVFFVVLFLITLGACSRLRELKFAFRAPDFRWSGGPTPKDAVALVASTLATLVAFLILQAGYLFVRLPSQIGNGVTYAEYARRGFGQLCVVVTIVAAVILLAEKFREPTATAQSRTLRKMEFALIAAAGLILLSAQRRILLYEQAYGYTVARLHATAYIVFMSGFLILLFQELRRGAIASTLGRRSSAFALALTFAILYWNDQAWIMNQNIDRVRVTGKFDVKYAASLSMDAFPALVRRKNELPRAARDALMERAACQPAPVPFEWYEWNSARSAALSASKAIHLPGGSTCSARLLSH